MLQQSSRGSNVTFVVHQETMERWLALGVATGSGRYSQGEPPLTMPGVTGS
jgi:hypothetical protein